MVDEMLVIGAKHGRHGLRIVVLVLLIAAVVGFILWMRRRRRDRGASHAIRHADSIPQEPKEIASRAGGIDSTPRWEGGVRGQPNAIEATNLTKRYGENLAVDDLTFEVKPGCVTGFLGPNGAGKSTTMRMIMGLDSPDGGSVAVNGHRYHELKSPLRQVGALLEARPSTRVAVPMPTSGCWRAPIRSHARGSTRYSNWSAWPQSPAAGGSVLAGHEPAPRHRRRSARRSGRIDVRRAGERAGHRRDPLGSPASANPCLGGPSRLRLEPPHERDGRDGRPRGRHREGPAHRPDAHRRVYGPELERLRSGSFARPGAATASSGSGGASTEPEPDGSLSVRGIESRGGGASGMGPLDHAPRTGAPNQRPSRRHLWSPPKAVSSSADPLRRRLRRPSRVDDDDDNHHAGRVRDPQPERSQSVHRSPRLGVDQVDHRPIDRLDAVGDGRRRHRPRRHRDLCPSVPLVEPVIGRPGAFDPTRSSLAGLLFAQLAIGVLGILVISAEYSTGTIRATFSAEPRRPLVLAAKVAVFGIVTLIVGEIVSFVAFFLGQRILSGKTPTAILSDPGVSGPW